MPEVIRINKLYELNEITKKTKLKTTNKIKYNIAIKTLFK